MALTLKYREQTAQYFTESLGDGFSLDMMQIPTGTFVMGTPEDEIERLCKEYESDYFRRESPQHLVNISQFYMGKYPITQAQWRVVANLAKVEIDLDPEPSNFKDNFEEEVDGKLVVIEAGQRPVEQVSWEDAKEFCARLRRETKRNYRLPTEAEWEYACRAVQIPPNLPLEGGNAIEEWNEKFHQPFHFGETIATNLANYDGDYTYGRGKEGQYRSQTTPVGFFDVGNRFGLYDMHGNVWEWCEDDYHDSYEGAPEDGTAWVNLEDENTTKILRGGSWLNYPWDCRSAGRNENNPAYRDDCIGFRVVCSLPGSP